MNLRSAHIQNFRAAKDLELRFEDRLGRIRPITVIAGPNGCGKTSAVFAILNALRGVMGYRTVDVPEPSALDIFTGDAQAGWTATRRGITVDLQIQFEDDERAAIRQVLNEALPAEPSSSSSEPDQYDPLDELPDGRMRLIWKYPPGHDANGKPKPWWWVAGTEPRYALPWLYGRKEVIRLRGLRQLSDPELLDQIGGIFLFPQDRSLHSRVLGDTTDRQSADDERSTSADRPLWGILEYLANYANAPRTPPLPEEENWELRIKKTFKQICGPREYAGFLWDSHRYPDGAPCLQDSSGAIYPLHLAASGEQVILEYITRLTYPRPLNHSLILIDEPEVHLHPGWARQLYQALPSIGVGNQFILTTHSPELRSMAAEDGALVDLGHLEAAPA